NTSAWSDQPYTITATFTPMETARSAQIANEPDNDSPTGAVPLSVSGQPTQGYFQRRTHAGVDDLWQGDIDYYQLSLPGAGRLQVHIDPPPGGGNWAQTGSLWLELDQLINGSPALEKQWTPSGVTPTQTLDATIWFDPTQATQTHLLRLAP